MYADIIIPDTKTDFFTYRLKDEHISEITPGRVVVVPFKNKKVKGVVYRTKKECELQLPEIKWVEEILPEDISTLPTLIKLAEWISQYYFSPLSETIKLFFPPKTLERETKEYRLRQQNIESKDPLIQYFKKRYPRWISLKTVLNNFGEAARRKLEKLVRGGIIEEREKIYTRKEKEFRVYPVTTRSIPHNPTPAQKEVLRKFKEKISHKPSTFLLFGATGSGKTMVYSWIMKEFVESGMSVIVLVPEISLTPQITDFFLRIFGDMVTFYHSALSDAERRWIFTRVRKGEKRVIVGPRSALFLPAPQLGLIVVDEEHDTSYKEEERTPCYNARDVAVFYGNLLNIPVILGSATPSLESFYNATAARKYTLLELKERIPGYSNPTIEIIDMKEEKTPAGISIHLLDEIKKTIESNKQVMLFLNRRGFSPYLICRDCGYIMKCPHCSVGLVYHKKEGVLKCHLCGYKAKIPDICLKCGSPNLKLMGVGTQKVEEVIKNLFSNIQIARMDVDAVPKKGMVPRIYEDFYQGKLKILVGTKMLGKGFDFPNLGLVGVINADIGLGMPDFRAEERSFQLLYQVAGRIRKGGKVIIQTHNPESRAISTIKKFDYRAFVLNELADRKKYGYPPYRRLTSIEIEGRDLNKVIEFSQTIFNLLEKSKKQEVELLGPASCPREKIRNKYRYRILLKYKKYENLNATLRVLKEIKIPTNFTLKVNVDPLDLM
ncbi:MAG TPA: primosomal protein N' [candidate division WOR-3 bacterium]|uniref:Replication restart protein PriA n=1 Tax=candidate division WOR-3 bacterium TaxID=2052148 RepID=A0A7V0Q5F6_UNCW3|nr:primosomal protein N' [candidate division WOR-3 bacterium]